MTAPLTTEQQNQFALELKALLLKWNAVIEFDHSDCSDLHGMSGERIVVTTKGRILVATHEGRYDMEASDL